MALATIEADEAGASSVFVQIMGTLLKKLLVRFILVIFGHFESSDFRSGYGDDTYLLSACLVFVCFWVFFLVGGDYFTCILPIPCKRTVVRIYFFVFALSWQVFCTQSSTQMGFRLMPVRSWSAYFMSPRRSHWPLRHHAPHLARALYKHLYKSNSF